MKEEQKAIDSSKAATLTQEKDLQKATTELEEKQLIFLQDLVKLEQRIDAITKNPSKMTADMGRNLQALYRAKISPNNLPNLIEDQKIVKDVPLA